jgi:plastocyanin
MPALPLLVAALVIGSAGLAPAARATDAAVSITDATYTPSTVTITVGEAVRWVVDSSLLHTVTSDSGEFASHDLGYKDTFGVIFDKPGTYLYHCKIHPMSGKVIVVRAGSTQSQIPVTETPATSPPAAPSSSASDPELSSGLGSPDAGPSSTDDGSQGISPIGLLAALVITTLVIVGLLFLVPARRGSKGGGPG